MLTKLNQISVNNYKILRGNNQLKILPFTFLFGKNGSGKTTLTNSIVFLKDMFNQIPIDSEEYDYYTPPQFNLNSSQDGNEYGKVDNLIIKSEDEMCFSFEWEIENDKRTEFKSYFSNSPNIMEFGFTLIKQEDNEISPRLLAKSFYIKALTDNTIDFYINFDLQKMDLLDSEFNPRFNSDIFEQKRKIYFDEDEILDFQVIFSKMYQENKCLSDSFLELLFNRSLFTFPYNIPTVEVLCKNFTWGEIELKKGDMIEEVIFNQIDNILKNSNNYPEDMKRDLESFLESVFITNFRAYFDLVDLSLKNTFRSFNRVKGVRYNFPRYGSNSSFWRFLNGNDISKMQENNDLKKILQNLQLANDFDMKYFNDVIFPSIVDELGNIINFADTSSGFQFLLPILAEITKKGNSNLYFIEQPELHLHPKLQTGFIEEVVKLNSSDKSILSQRRNCSFVFETHSEHIIRKIQVMIAKGELSKDDVAVYYFDKKDGETKVKEMKIDDMGQFEDEWPDGFFDDSANLMIEMMEAIKGRSN